MATSSQLTFGPTPANRVSSAVPTDANSVSNGVTLADLVLSAGRKLGLQDKQLAGLFDLDKATFSASFSLNNTERNRLMKVPLPMELARQIAIDLCEATGLAVGGPDAERHAIADLMASAANFIRVMQR